MASSSDDKGKRPLEEDCQDPKLKEGQMTGGSSGKDPTFVGSMSARRAFSHNMQGPTLPVRDLSFLPAVEEGLLVTKDFFLVWGKLPVGTEKSGFQKYRKYRPKYR
jgi:hypothetical protein